MGASALFLDNCMVGQVTHIVLLSPSAPPAPPGPCLRPPGSCPKPCPARPLPTPTRPLSETLQATYRFWKALRQVHAQRHEAKVVRDAARALHERWHGHDVPEEARLADQVGVVRVAQPPRQKVVLVANDDRKVLRACARATQTEDEHAAQRRTRPAQAAQERLTLRLSSTAGLKYMALNRTIPGWLGRSSWLPDTTSCCLNLVRASDDTTAQYDSPFGSSACAAPMVSAPRDISSVQDSKSLIHARCRGRAAQRKTDRRAR